MNSKKLAILLAACTTASITACARQSAIQPGLPTLNQQVRYQANTKQAPQQKPRLRSMPRHGFKSDAGLAAASQRMKENQFVRMDHNQDGALQVSECWFGIELFVKIDEDRNGVLSRAEFMGSDAYAEYNHLNPEHLRQSASTYFNYTDTNKDGGISTNELLYALMPQQPMPICSPAGPGYPPCTSPYPSPSPINEWDLRELKIQIINMFNLSDKNYDSRLDPSEYEDMYAFSLLSNSEVPYPNPISSATPTQPHEPIPSATTTSLPRK